MTLKISVLSLLAAAIAFVPASIRAQDAATNAPAAASEQPVPAKHKPMKHDQTVFNGKLTAVDTNAMTLTVGKRTFAISSETKITKTDEPATLADGVVGEMVGGTYKQDADGKMTATTIHFNPKSKVEKKKKKKANADDMSSSTNSVPN